MMWLISTIICALSITGLTVLLHYYLKFRVRYAVQSLEKNKVKTFSFLREILPFVVALTLVAKFSISAITDYTNNTLNLFVLASTLASLPIWYFMIKEPKAIIYYTIHPQPLTRGVMTGG